MTRTVDNLADRLAHAESQLAFFMDLGRRLTATLDDREVMEIIATSIHRYLCPSHTTLYITGGNRRSYQMGLACGYTPTDHQQERHIPIHEGCCGEVLRTGQRLRLDAGMLRALPDLPEDLPPGMPLSDMLCVPILHGKRPLAAVLITQGEHAGPFTDEHIARLDTLLEQCHLALDRALLYRKTADLAITDDLTQLFNHRYIHQFLDLELSQDGPQTMTGLVFMDMDRFKSINDTHGHLAGSQALAEAGAILSDNLRTGDIIARYGGDEFVIILPKTTLDRSVEIAQRLCRAMDETRFLVNLGGRHITASFGVAAHPLHAESPRSLVLRADQAMYQAKARGGNRVVTFEPHSGHDDRTALSPNLQTTEWATEAPPATTLPTDPLPTDSESDL